jgi:hypothetical protein
MISGRIGLSLPHPTRQTLVSGPVESLMRFVVPSVFYEIVVLQGVSDRDTLRRHLGDYITDAKMIEIQRKLAQALAGTDRDRSQLLTELTDATREVYAGNIFPKVDAGIRTLGLMRANYVKGDADKYAKGLEEIFPELKEPSPAQRDPSPTTNL